MLLPAVQVDLVVPDVIGFGREQRLVVEECFYCSEVASLGCDVEAGRAIVRWLVGHLLPAQLSNDMCVAVERSIIHAVVSLLVFDLPIGQFVFDQDLSNHLVSETASQHQGSDPVGSDRKIHVNVVVNGSKV